MAAQDLPPPGGFGNIATARTFPKPLIRQGFLLAGSAFMTIYGAIYLGNFRKRLRVLRIEQMEHYIATMPFLLAEQERKYLTNLWKMRETERELMKDHEGWVVGTLYGEPVFKTIPKGYLPPISPTEFTNGRPHDEWNLKVNVPDWWM